MNESYVRVRTLSEHCSSSDCVICQTIALTVCLSVCTSEQLKRIRYCVRGELYWPNSVGLLAATGSGNTALSARFRFKYVRGRECCMMKKKLMQLMMKKCINGGGGGGLRAIGFGVTGHSLCVLLLRERERLLVNLRGSLSFFCQQSVFSASSTTAAATAAAANLSLVFSLGLFSSFALSFTSFAASPL